MNTQSKLRREVEERALCRAKYVKLVHERVLSEAEEFDFGRHLRSEFVIVTRPSCAQDAFCLGSLLRNVSY